MKLAHPELSLCMDFDEAKTDVQVCVIESPIRWREIQKELLLQYNGGDGQWVLSERDKELSIEKKVEMIYNPLQLEENQRKMLTAFIKSLAEKAVSEVHWREGQELNSRIQGFFGKLETEYPFDFCINPELDFTALAKAMGLQIETQYDTDMERLLQYCLMTKELVKPQLFIFWNLRMYFSEEEMELFYAEIRRRGWKVLLIEHLLEYRLPGEKWYIIDKDNCEIY